MKTEPQDGLWLVSEKPDLKRLNEEWVRAGGLASQSVRRDWNDRIRQCRWRGRTSDYKKHRKALGVEPVPWENAWDGRVSVADDIISDLCDVLGSAFRRAQFKARPGGAQDIEKASYVDKVMNKYRDRLGREWADEADLLAQFGLSYGSAVWHCSWDRQLAMKMQKVTMEQLGAAAQQAAQALQSGQPLPPEQAAKLEMLASLPALILDPAQEEMLGGIVQYFARQIAGQLYTQERASYGDDFLENYELSDRQARQVVRDLRTEGRAEFPAPYLHRNGPCVVARQVGYDYFAPPETTTLNSAPWHTVREWLTPAQILENKTTDGWDAKWCDEAVKTAGTSSVWGDRIRTDEDFDSEDGSETYAYLQSNTQNGLVEVLHTYVRCVTAEGVPQIWCSVWCPHVLKSRSGADLFARHYPTGRAEYDFDEYRWKKVRRNFHENQGVPEIVGSDQQQIKRTLDQLEDRKDLEINPAWLVSNRLSMRYLAGPGGQVPRKRQGDIEPMPPPTGNPELGFKLIEHTYKRLSNKFGLQNEYVLPVKWQTKLQAMTERYLSSCEAMFSRVLKLIQENATPEELAAMAGGDPGFPTTREQIEGEYSVSLYFDVKDLDMEFVWKKLEAVTKLAVPLDRAGVIDLATLVKLIVGAIDPTYAAVLITDKAGAGQKVFREVKNEIALMYVGNEAEYTKNDPTAQMKLDFARQIIQGDAEGQGANPEYLEALGALPNGSPQKVKPRFQELLQKYEQNLQQSLKQEKNKETGALGVARG